MTNSTNDAPERVWVCKRDSIARVIEQSDVKPCDIEYQRVYQQSALPPQQDLDPRIQKALNEDFMKLYEPLHQQSDGELPSAQQLYTALTNLCGDLYLWECGELGFDAVSEGSWSEARALLKCSPEDFTARAHAPVVGREQAELLLRSWLACMRSPRPSDWEVIANNLCTDTAALLDKKED